MVDAGTQVMIDNAKAQASALETAQPTDAVCPSHGQLARAEALSLRICAELLRRDCEREDTAPITLKGLAKIGAGIGVPTPICALIYMVGAGKGWW